MRNLLATVLAVLVMFGLLTLVTRREQARADELNRLKYQSNALAVGTPVKAFKLPDLDGRLHRLPPPGRRVLINYWASWCGPCLQEMPALRDFAQRTGDKGTQVVGIALDVEANTRTWLHTNPVAYPVLIELPGKADSSEAMGNRLGLLPFSVLVGADGRVLATRTGPFRDTADLDKWLAQAR